MFGNIAKLILPHREIILDGDAGLQPSRRSFLKGVGAATASGLILAAPSVVHAVNLMNVRPSNHFAIEIGLGWFWIIGAGCLAWWGIWHFVFSESRKWNLAQTSLALGAAFCALYVGLWMMGP